MLKTTLIMIGYNIERFNKNKDIIFNNYDKLYKYFDKFIFIWNNLNSSIPKINLPKNLKVEIIKSKENSLCNRHYIPYKNINTQSVLIIDDDIILSDNCIKGLINTWEKNKNCLIGLDKRYYDKFGNYKIKKDNSNDTLLTIGQTMMYHKKYMLEFKKNKKLRNYVDNLDPSRSDDIALQLMINFINKKPSTIVLDKNCGLKILDSSGAVSEHKDRFALRSKSIKYILKYFKNIDNEKKEYKIHCSSHKNLFTFLVTFLLLIFIFIFLK